MKKIGLVAAFAGVVALVVTGALLNTGCEEGTGTEALILSPTSASFAFSNTTVTNTTNGVSGVVGDSVVFTVVGGYRELSLPLAWSVTDPNLGTVASSGGYSAVYKAYEGRHGVNAIRVQDQYAAVGVAQIDQ